MDSSELCKDKMLKFSEKTLNLKLLFTKETKSAFTPTKGSEFSAGYDLKRYTINYTIYYTIYNYTHLIKKYVHMHFPGVIEV